MLCKNFSRQHFEIFFLFFLENRIDTSCKLSPKETICMKCQILLSPKETICTKCQILFSRKNKKNIISLSSAESAYSVVSVKWSHRLRNFGLIASLLALLHEKKKNIPQTRSRLHVCVGWCGHSLLRPLYLTEFIYLEFDGRRFLSIQLWSHVNF